MSPSLFMTPPPVWTAWPVISDCPFVAPGWALRSHQPTREVARYIVENPVPAGLVRDPCGYPHIGSDLWTIDDLLGSI